MGSRISGARNGDVVDKHASEGASGGSDATGADAGDARQSDEVGNVDSAVHEDGEVGLFEGGGVHVIRGREGGAGGDRGESKGGS